MNISRFLIQPNLTIKEAMQLLGKAGERILYVVNENGQLQGTLTDGDIRRWVLDGGRLTVPVSRVFNKNPKVVKEGYDPALVKDMMIRRKNLSIPVVNDDGRLIDILFWDTLFGEEIRRPKDLIQLPVMIMAGGKGTRLDPFTRVLPKPLLPIGDKTIIETIMDRFGEYGIRQFFLSINHQSRLMRAYFEEADFKYSLNFVEEPKPLGTAGALSLIRSKVKTSVIVSNCDILIDGDYHEIVRFHETNDHDITIVGSFRHFTIPYGICQIENGGRLVSIQEKPEHDYLVNTGMYILNKRTLKSIPRKQFFNMTDLIQKVRDDGGRVSVFPLEEKAWIDIGQWEEFHRSMKMMKMDF